MEPEYKDKSIELFIAVMKIVMGILGVFSFCYVVSALGLIDWQYYLPAPKPNPIVMENSTYTKKENQIKLEEEVTPKYKEEKEESIEEENQGLYGHWDEFLKNYNDKIDSYFNKGFYYKIYKDSLEKEKEEAKQKEEQKKKDDYFHFEKKDEDDSYYLDEYGWFINPDVWKNPDTGRYDFNDIFPWSFNF